MQHYYDASNVLYLSRKLVPLKGIFDLPQELVDMLPSNQPVALCHRQDGLKNPFTANRWPFSVTAST